MSEVKYIPPTDLKHYWDYRVTAVAVRNHALANYENGWDDIVETMTEDDLAVYLSERRLWKTSTAIKHLAEQIKFREAYAYEIIHA